MKGISITICLGDDAAPVYIGSVVINTDKWQNIEKEIKDEKGRDKKSSAKSRKMAKESRRYNLSKEGLSGKSVGLGSEVDGI